MDASTTKIYNNFEVKFRKNLLEDYGNRVKLRAKKSNNSKEIELVKSFHEILRPVIFIGNIFSLFPIAGIFSGDSTKIRFYLYYPFTIYAIIVLFAFTTELIFLMMFHYRAGFQFFMVGQTVFTFVCCFGAYFFFYLAYRWPRIMTKWMKSEKLFLSYPYSDKIKPAFVKKIWFVAGITITLSLCDHYIYLLSASERTALALMYCDESKRDFLRHLYVSERQVFFMILPYHAVWIPFMEWYEVCKTMCWTYSEVFVSVTALTLSTRFIQFTNRLKMYEKRHMSEVFWNEAREHYNILCNLALLAEKLLSPVILVYSFSNLFFTCQKVFMQFERSKLPWDRIYSFLSAVFLVVRTGYMLYFGAQVNEKSQDVLKVMREVPNENYNGLNYRRLLDVLYSNRVALSGYRFFFVTKSIILALAGTIITYELVLIQQIDDIDSQSNMTSNACGEVLI